jgi:hypothetical protein
MRGYGHVVVMCEGGGNIYIVPHVQKPLSLKRFMLKLASPHVTQLDYSPVVSFKPLDAT